MEMAQEVLGLFLVSLEERNINTISPSNPSVIACNDNEFVTLVATPIEKYRKKNKAIKKTLTIPLVLPFRAVLTGRNLFIFLFFATISKTTLFGG